MAYESRPMGNRLGLYAAKVEDIREREGLTPSGFKKDGTDMLASEKEDMARARYERADAHLPAGLVVAPASTSEPAPEADDDPSL